MAKILNIIICLLLFDLSACAVTTKKPHNLKALEALDNPDIIRFPLTTTSHGRWVVTVTLDDNHKVDMILDTGATYSAFFNDSVDKFNLIVDDTNLTRIHGLVANSYASNTVIEHLSFGTDSFYNKSFAILPETKNNTDKVIAADGLIGMDIMENYRVFVDVKKSQIYFIPIDFPDLLLPGNMTPIPLSSNPYRDVAPRLNFLTLSIKNKEIPALLDTGTDVHIINWHAATFVEAHALRAQLKWRWKLAGAVGEFKPVIRAHVNEVRSGGYKWQDVNMIIKDTDSLDIIGISDKPILIAGIEFFDNRNVYLDFKNNKLWLQIKHLSHDDDKILTICQSC